MQDYNPGIEENGLFWTVPMPPRSLRVGRSLNKAAITATNYPVRDYYSLENALASNAVSEPAVVTYEVTWYEPGPAYTDGNAHDRYTGEFHDCLASIKWSAQSLTSGVTYSSTRSDPLFAILGHERNGVFYDA